MQAPHEREHGSVQRGYSSARDIERQRLICTAAKLCRILPYGYRVHIGYAVYAVILLLKSFPVAYGSEIIAYRQIAARLYS